MNNVSKYRKEATDSYTYNDLVNYGFDDNKTELVPVNEVENVIDQIESDVKEITSLLDDIKGLSEIEEIKEKLNSLEEKLY